MRSACGRGRGLEGRPMIWRASGGAKRPSMGPCRMSRFSAQWCSKPYGKTVLISTAELMGLDAGPGKPGGGPRARSGAMRPNVGLASSYAARLTALIDEMHNSILYWLRAAYRANPPATMAMDDVSWRSIQKAMKELARRWMGRFDIMAERLAKYFAQSVATRTDASLRKILTDGGFALKDWTLTAAQRDALGAIVSENVSLIKSIPREYLGKVERDVYRSVAAGRDLKQLTDDLQEHYGVTRKRAKLIALQQNNSATAKLARVRLLNQGLKQAIWMHSSAGKIPRPTHLAAGRRGQVFDLAKGWYDPNAHGEGKGDWILPGVLPNCRCSMRPVIPGVPIGKVKPGFAA